MKGVGNFSSRLLPPPAADPYKGSLLTNNNFVAGGANFRSSEEPPEQRNNGFTRLSNTSPDQKENAHAPVRPIMGGAPRYSPGVAAANLALAAASCGSNGNGRQVLHPQQENNGCVVNGNWGAIQYSPKIWPQKCPKKGPQKPIKMCS